jgi:hypothetical protein
MEKCSGHSDWYPTLALVLAFASLLGFGAVIVLAPHVLRGRSNSSSRGSSRGPIGRLSHLVRGAALPPLWAMQQMSRRDR